MPNRDCEVTADSDSLQRWVPIEAASAFEATIYYWGKVTALMAGPGILRPTRETIFQVRIDGRVNRAQAKRALEWANQLAERRIRGARR